MCNALPSHAESGVACNPARVKGLLCRCWRGRNLLAVPPQQCAIERNQHGFVGWAVSHTLATGRGRDGGKQAVTGAPLGGSRGGIDRKHLPGFDIEGERLVAGGGEQCRACLGVFLSVNGPAALLMLVTRSPGTTIRLGLTLLIGKIQVSTWRKGQVTAVAAMVVGATASTRRGAIAMDETAYGLSFVTSRI